jgi:hypothetical protein
MQDFTRIQTSGSLVFKEPMREGHHNAAVQVDGVGGGQQVGA